MDSIFVFLRLLSILGMMKIHLFVPKWGRDKIRKEKRMDPLHRGTRRFSLFFSLVPPVKTMNPSLPIIVTLPSYLSRYIILWLDFSILCSLFLGSQSVSGTASIFVIIFLLLTTAFIFTFLSPWDSDTIDEVVHNIYRQMSKESPCCVYTFANKTQNESYNNAENITSKILSSMLFQNHQITYVLWKLFYSRPFFPFFKIVQIFVLVY